MISSKKYLDGERGEKWESLNVMDAQYNLSNIGK